MVEVILPGTYVTVRDEALISAGQVVSGNIGIVGTASKGELDKVEIIGSFSEAREIFGDTQDKDGPTLIRALEQIYNNGGRTVYAVRTAQKNQTTGQSYAVAAAYQTKDESSSSADLVTLVAKEPGTWGNDIRITISKPSPDSITEVTEELSGTDKKLKRSHVVTDSGLNRITVRQKSTGQVISYQIVSGDPAGDKPEVKLDANGNLTFTKLASVAPVAEDTIVATYQVPAANSKQVELTYQTAKELYLIADGAHLAGQVNHSTKGSKLISVVIPSSGIPSDWYKLPKNTNDKGELFGTGLDGHTRGSNGENATNVDYQRSLEKLENEIINIVLLAGQDVAQMLTVLDGHLKKTAEIKRERIGIIGSSLTKEEVATIAGHPCNSDRLIFVAPGIQVSPQETLSGAYTAAAVAGLISSLPVQASPTNKTLTIPGLSKRFSSSQLENLVTHRVLMVEQRDGFRIVKGITTATNTAWHQITTRRIVDYAIYGVRSGCDPYIGKLNNSRVRGAMKATLDAFLTRMVQDEALISYELAVTATRPQEINGEAIVTMTLRPTFSIDFIKVTMYLG